MWGMPPHYSFKKTDFPMRKNQLSLLFAFVLLVGACRKNEPATELVPGGNTTELDELIRAKLETEGRFEWQWATDEQIWAAVSNVDYVMSVGYQPAGEQNVRDRIHTIDINDSRWSAARQSVLGLILESERKLDPDVTAESLTAFTEEVLPVVDVVVRNPATITLLRASGLVRYAEPMAYEPRFGAADRSDSGCGSNSPAGGLTTPSDYTNIAPDCKQSWNHSFHQINQAWESSTGSGVRVMIIDTGCSPDQDNLGEAFNQGNSSGRSISKLVTLPRPTIFGIPYGPAETPIDVCGHGTSMLGACGAPRGTDGAAAGVAYNCNFTSVRAAVDVLLNESREVKGVADAFVLAGNTSSVKIVSLSLGRLTSASQITDGVAYAHNQGKMIFAAAGTSFSWTGGFVGVIFPANLTQCIAITGIKDNLTTRCASCHQGSKVDFVLVMEKTSTGLHPLSLAMEGDDPSTVGGSSVSTASIAGIASLVWAKYPGWTRLQVFNRLKTSSSNANSRHPNFGWGRINAQVATQ